MKLLFDENLSPKLIPRLADLFPDSENALTNGLAKTGDPAIWRYAKSNGFSIVTTDRDFTVILRRLGSPPKLIWLENCDYPTSVAAQILRSNALRILEFGKSDRALLRLRA